MPRKNLQKRTNLVMSLSLIQTLTRYIVNTCWPLRIDEPINTKHLACLELTYFILRFCSFFF